MTIARTNDLLDARVTVPQHVVHRAFPTETVVLNLETGRYHGLNPIAGRMLEVLEKLGSVGESAAQLAREFEQPLERIEHDLGNLCSDLRDRGLVEIAGDA
ncbi:MAG: PqqD family protein [Thermoleophilaceae bacterium]